MAVVAEVNRWSAAAVDWSDISIGGQPYEQNEKIRAWITAVNANPSNASRQLEMWKDENTSTNPSSNMGFVLRAGYANNTNQFYMGGYGSATSWDVRLSSAWNDNGSESGYGLNSSTGYYNTDSQSRGLNGSTDADLYVAYDTEDGKEFMFWGWGSNTLFSEDWFGIMKTNFGEWMFLANDSTNFNTITYDADAAVVCAFVGSVILTGTSGSRVSSNADTSGSSTMLRILSGENVNTVNAAGSPSAPLTHAANPKIGHFNNYICSRAGQYGLVDKNTANETMLCCVGVYAPPISLGTFSYFTTV